LDTYVASARNRDDQTSRILIRNRNTLTVGSIDDATDQGHGARHRIFAIYREAASEASAEIAEMFKRHAKVPFSRWPEPDKEVVRSKFGVLDTISREIYFGSGAYSRDGYPARSVRLPDDAQRRFYQEARPLFELLAQAVAAPVAHHLIETLEFFVPVDPAEVFRLVAQSIRTAETGGYTLESMGSGLFVRVIERYLADHREVFADPARRSDLVDALDAFVRAGWPDARSLTYRIADIWR
jgi:hypothetical protein